VCDSVARVRFLWRLADGGWFVCVGNVVGAHASRGGPRIDLDMGCPCAMYRPAHNVSRVGSAQR
jgi:hypothetical protein